jgi:hypothetical protein
MPPSPATWTVEFLFHTWNCDVQLAVGPLDTIVDAERVAAETPALTRVKDRFVLHFEDRCLILEETAAIVHGDFPTSGIDSLEAGPFAFVNAWVFPLRKPIYRATTTRSARAHTTAVAVAP